MGEWVIGTTYKRGPSGTIMGIQSTKNQRESFMALAWASSGTKRFPRKKRRLPSGKLLSDLDPVVTDTLVSGETS